MNKREQMESEWISESKREANEWMRANRSVEEEEEEEADELAPLGYESTMCVCGEANGSKYEREQIEANEWARANGKRINEREQMEATRSEEGEGGRWARANEREWMSESKWKANEWARAIGQWRREEEEAEELAPLGYESTFCRGKLMELL